MLSRLASMLAPAQPKPDAAAHTEHLLISALKAQSLELAHAAHALDTAAAALNHAGKGSAANQCKQAALRATKAAQEWQD